VLFIVLQANLQLVNSLLGGLQGFCAVPAEIVGGVLQVSLRIAKSCERIMNFRMLLRRSCSRRCG
jgi:hypothetical protein